MIISMNGLPDGILGLSENDIGGNGDGNVSVELPKDDVWNPDNSDNIEILVENTTRIVEYCGETGQKLSDIEECSIFILVACGLVFGAICALILDGHFSSGVK